MAHLFATGSQWWLAHSCKVAALCRSPCLSRGGCLLACSDACAACPIPGCVAPLLLVTSLSAAAACARWISAPHALVRLLVRFTPHSNCARERPVRPQAARSAWRLLAIYAHPFRKMRILLHYHAELEELFAVCANTACVRVPLDVRVPHRRTAEAYCRCIGFCMFQLLHNCELVHGRRLQLPT